MKAARLFWSCWHEAAQLLRRGPSNQWGQNTWWEKVAGAQDAVCGKPRLPQCTAAPACSQDVPHLPPLIGRWPQMRDDLMACVCVFSLPQSAISRDICNELAGHTAAIGSWEQHILMGVVRSWRTRAVIKVLPAIFLGYDNRDISLQTVRGKSEKPIICRLMSLTSEKPQRIKR